MRRSNPTHTNTPASALPRCAQCPRKSGKQFGRTPVHGQGPTDALIIFVGEGPAKQETMRGVPFVGDSGQELDGLYLPVAGLSRPEVFVTNITRCPMEEYANPGDSLARCCSTRFLEPEITRIKPALIVTLGAVSGRQFIPDLHLERDHGIPRYCYWAGAWRGWVMPMYHPAAGIHEGSMMTHLMEDFRRLNVMARWIKSGSQGPCPASPPPDHYEGLEDYRRIRTVEEFQSVWVPGLVADTDTEDDSTGAVLCLSFSQIDGTGYLIHRNNPEVLAAFNDAVQLSGFGFHYLLHDTDKLADLGVNVDLTRLWRLNSSALSDTMVTAFHWSVSQGLKTLAYRLLSIRMRDWDDVVTPHFEAQFWSWLQGRFDGLKPKELKALYGKSTAWSRVKRIWSDWSRERNNRAAGKVKIKKSGEESRIDPWGRWKGLEPDQKREVISMCDSAGWPRPPGKGLEIVPEDEMIRYACQDADSTGRLRRLMADRKTWEAAVFRKLSVR